MKQVKVVLNYCVVCGKMYDDENNLIEDNYLRLLVYKTSQKNVNLKIRKGTCGICQN